MNTKQKAKAYDEALKTATQWIKDGCSDKEKICLESIFPQLRESEDEKALSIIRKRMCYDPVPISDEDRRIVENWLEKQKEQKPRWEINNPHTTKWTKEMIDEKFEELVEEYHKQKPVVTHGETYHVDTLGTQQVIAGKMPQKPADEQFPPLEGLDAIKAKYYDDGFKNGFDEGVESVKPADWSEEDEEMLNSCISSIEEAKENRYAYKETDGDTSYDHEIAWLKSLRPVSKEFLQPHWKPSEEHFQGLRRAILKADTGSDAERTLKDIYEQLKKL